MGSKIVFVFFSLLTIVASATYDQRQTGDLNVQVDLKDLRVVGYMKKGKEEYVDYDYAYDYSEMTIKPQNGTTAKPSASQSVNPSTNQTGDTEPTVTVGLAVTTTLVNNASYEFTTEAIALDSTAAAFYAVSYKNTTSINATDNSSKCKRGFTVNNKGDCELKLQSTGNALLKLVKLSQKLKLRRENKGAGTEKRDNN